MVQIGDLREIKILLNVSKILHPENSKKYERKKEKSKGGTRRLMKEEMCKVIRRRRMCFGRKEKGRKVMWQY